MAERASIWPAVGGLLLSLVQGLASADARSLEDIRSCVRSNLPESSFTQHLALTSWDGGGGSRELLGKLYGERSSSQRLSLMMRVDAPQDLDGARYLLNRRETREQMYVYLPALGKTRRIAGGMKGQPLWGTDFSYEDIRHLQGAMDDALLEMLGDGQLQQRKVHKLRLQPAPELESAYSHIELDIDQLSCLPLQVRFFDNSGVAKTMQVLADKISQQDGRWLIGEVEMKNHRGQTHSSLSLSEYVFDPDLSKALFNPQAFHVAR